MMKRRASFYQGSKRMGPEPGVSVRRRGGVCR